MPSSLAQTQAWFFAQLQPKAKRSNGPVRKYGTLSVRARVDIYVDMYLSRLTEALAAEFPRLREALGEKAFSKLAADYFARHPSRRPTIQHVGAELDRHLARRPVRGFARDLVKLEAVASEVYLAPGLGDGPLLTAEALRAVQPEAWSTLTFSVTPTLRLVKLAWTFPKGGLPAHEPSVVRVWRKGLDAFEAQVGKDELRALRAVMAGKTFGQVCVAAGSAGRAATLLATWLEEGLLLDGVRRAAPARRHQG